MSTTKYRLITRSDFDGLVSAVLLKELGIIDEIMFVHPKDMQDGLIAVTDRDITTNLPYVEGVHLAFDHHSSEMKRLSDADMLAQSQKKYITVPHAPSTARVIYDYYGGKARFVGIPDDLMRAVDRADSAYYEIEDILSPKDWTLLNFIMDSRTGLGRFRDFKVSNKQLMMDMIEYCRHFPVEKILNMPDVKERIDLYHEHNLLAKQQLHRCTRLEGEIAIIDFADETPIYACNRFLVYAMFPQATVSIHRIMNATKDKIVFAVGKSIVNRRSRAVIGNIMLEYGGGGHDAAGTCQIDLAEAERVLEEIKEKLHDAGASGVGIGRFLSKIKNRMIRAISGRT
ncbi:MAG: exopolyphosphatase [Alphaproteobacteria bacterium]|nr:exopolyphosphatase [Alphaproteobacteria bacterium]